MADTKNFLQDDDRGHPAPQPLDLCRKALEAVDHGVMMAEARGDLPIVYVNPAFEQLTGYTADVILNRSWRVLHGEEPDQDGLMELKNALAAGESCKVVLRHYRQDGSRFMNHLSLSPVRDEKGDVSHFIAVMEDATERFQRQEQRVAEAEFQRDMLVREVHHRIKNSLQGVSGLLARHAYAHPELADTLKEAGAQVNAIATVHGLQGRVMRTELEARELVEAIARVAGTANGVPIEVRAEPGPDGTSPARVNSDEGVAVALIINELILNAQKHGTNGDGCGVIVTVRWDEAETAIEVENCGDLPDGFHLAEGRGLGTGLELARSMLPPKPSTLAISQRPGRVVATLRFYAPS